MAKKATGAFCRWPGSKASLAPKIIELMPEKIDRYAEPFLGGGSVFFALAHAGRFSESTPIVLSDANDVLINAWRQVQSNVSGVATSLDSFSDDKETFIALRDNWMVLSDDTGRTLDAARFLYLNRATFNGLWRMNKAGKLNMPYGAIPAGGRDLTQRPKLFAARNVLNDYDVDILAQGYAETMTPFGEQHQDGVVSVCYLDPPYMPVSKTAKFDTYTADGFGPDEQIALELAARKLVHAGVIVVASGADTEVTRHVWRSSCWKRHEVKALRRINSDGAKRGMVGELLFVGVPR
jgi:DNA adenine methylase